MKDINNEGEFGPVFSQFIGKPNEAIRYLLSIKKGEALAALFHRDIGDISMVYGSDTYGLKKIASKHPEVLLNIQELINEMNVIANKSGENRIRLESHTHFAVVSRDYFGVQRTPWLLTAFEKKNSVPDNTMDTGETHTGERNDTATPQDTVSINKDNDKKA